MGSARSKRVRRLSIAGVVLAALVGVFIGVSGFTFVEARGWSYLSNDPTTCVNCHIMREQYDSWQKSSHHAFAVCNDCHVPLDFFGKYWTIMWKNFEASWTGAKTPDAAVNDAEAELKSTLGAAIIIR